MILPIRMIEKVWGREHLPAPFSAPDGQRIGEVWFEPPAALDQLLVKYIFTSEKLSVQCHPSDEQTQAMGLGKQGKEECWLVVDAEPGATLGIGFDAPLDSEAMRAAAEDGSIVDLMTWYQVKAGDFFYIPASTVHAIGPGCTIIEIQRNSDITYRLYDYDRPRALHLEEAAQVACGEPYDLAANSTYVGHDSDVNLVDGPLFRLDQLAGGPDAAISARYRGPLLVIPREGSVVVDGETVSPGQCALAEEIDAVQFAEAGTCLIAQPMPG
ncbi:mannose-6-phosphate isomerase [Aurantiacibacter xanthus]|uniref:Mannose-6-phosphate isomerase n=1 Tax=Aurantiacibacter xanthus TaxID=1784712 RepID=A0A3A1PGC9_9SPHN|nr:class I mannose-6-phosphate isomerase [Aurantiacibacter xanthus]RIV92868.1 mannose-6-phosphate isomerase [Aurantiacibacter xanthus]